MKVDKRKWNISKFKNIGESLLGKTLDSKRNKGSLKPYLCSINVEQGNIRLDSLKEFRIEDGELERYSIKKGDLLICEGGDAGRCAIWNYDIPMYYQNALHRVRFKDGIYNRYIMFYLHYCKHIGIIANLSKGQTIQHFTQKSLHSLNVPVPPLSEQQAIASELDAIQDLISKHKEQLKDYDNLAKSIFNEMFGDVVSNEKGWERKKLSDLCSEVTSSKRIFAKEYVSDGIPFYRIKEIIEKSKGLEPTVELFISTDRYNEIRNIYDIPKKGDLLISAVGTIGAIWIVDGKTPFYFKDGNVIWIKMNSLNNPIFMKYLLTELMNVYKKSIPNGSAYSALTINKLQNISVNNIPLSLQQTFAHRIEAIEKQKELVKQQITDLQTLFDSRMQYYFD